jgi:hypothetical protein
VVPIADDAPNPEYLDAFLQGARFALFALEGRVKESSTSLSPELADSIDEVHEMVSTTRKGIQARDTSSVSAPTRFLGKN